MSVIEIKPYVEYYKEEVVALILHIQQNEFSIPITIEEQPDLKEIAGFYQVGNGNFWVALANNKVIGTIALLDIGDGKGALRKMFVAEAYRGKAFGVGQLLVETVFKWAVQKDMKEIYLGTTEKFIAAQRFYEKNGFVEIDKERLPKSFPVMQVDVKFYLFSSNNNRVKE